MVILAVGLLVLIATAVSSYWLGYTRSERSTSWHPRLMTMIDGSHVWLLPPSWIVVGESPNRSLREGTRLN